jgi:hypothetical protein
MILNLLCIPLMSWLDRQRGMPKDIETIPKGAALVGMGYLCAYLTGHALDVQAIIITLTVAFSHNFGFGEPIGHALTGTGGATADDGTTYETWQVGVLKTNPWMALTVRGLMVGLWTLLAMDWLASLKIALAFGLAFPLASAFVRYALKSPPNAWAIQEWIRGGLIGTFLIIGGV